MKTVFVDFGTLTQYNIQYDIAKHYDPFKGEWVMWHTGKVDVDSTIHFARHKELKLQLPEEFVRQAVGKSIKMTLEIEDG